MFYRCNCKNILAFSNKVRLIQKCVRPSRQSSIENAQSNIKKTYDNVLQKGTIVKKINQWVMLSKMNKSLLSTSNYCLQITVFLYGGWFMFTEICSSVLPFGLICVIFMTGALHFARVPFPDQKAVEAIIGTDLINAVGTDYVVKTIAHRGAGLDAPENSLAAFKMCQEKGYDFIEFDVSITKDEVPVVFHDNTLERMTDKLISINSSNWSELSKINISVKHPFKDRYSETYIPTLDETVRQLLSSEQKMFIDLKDNNTKMVKAILNLYQNYPELYSKAIVVSFFPNLLYLIRRSNRKIICGMPWRPYAFANESFSYTHGPGLRRSNTWYGHNILTVLDTLHEWLIPRITYYMIGLSVILLHKDSIDAKTILRWREKGVRVMAWTVNTPIEKQYFSKTLKITYLTDTLTGESSTHSAPS